MNYIIGSDISKVLDIKDRIYLCGDLKKPQQLEWIEDERLEIGMSRYKGGEFQADIPHYHETNTEYNFVLSGTTKFLLIDERREMEFEKGSLIVVPPGTKYASKHKAGTEILFIKIPAGDDKVIVDVDESIQDWLKDW